MNTVTAIELKKKFDNNEDILLIDLREDYEFEDFNIGGINIPMDQVLNTLDKIDFNKPVFFCCRSGKKSAAITHTIKRKLGLENVYSLKGGVNGFFEEINN